MKKDFRKFLEDEIYEIEEMSKDIRYGYEAGVHDSYTYLLKKYDEFHKPVAVPDFVAEWIEETKEKGHPLAYAINCAKGELGKWLHECDTDIDTEENQELFAEAWLVGYEVEEEPKYVIKLPMSTSRDVDFALVDHTGDIWVDAYPSKYKLTEQEILSLPKGDVYFKYFSEPVKESDK